MFEVSSGQVWSDLGSVQGRSDLVLSCLVRSGQVRSGFVWSGLYQVRVGRSGQV